VNPEIAVVVASHDRPLRLRWLLNALEEQTLARARFEVVVAHDSSSPETAALLGAHPLAAAGVLRALHFDPGPGPAAKRNAAWRAARAPLIAFTDDDCRPPAEWLEGLLGAMAAHPGRIVQGATVPDPDERHLLHAAPGARSQLIEPPTIWAQTCNIGYPRDLLVRAGGFDERLPVASGEDTDLALRARAVGAEIVAAPDAVTYHAVDAPWLLARVRGTWRWQHLAHLVKRHPELREGLVLGAFWKRSHLLVVGAGVGFFVLRRRAPALALAAAVPWAIEARPRYGSGLRGRLRALSELPGRAVVDATEVAALARGSARYRTLLL